MDLLDLANSSTVDHDTEVENICIIGAGAGGLAALKAILDSPHHKSGQWKATVFEAREDIGGIWLPAPPMNDPPLTPLYDSLTTNLPHPVMGFTGFPFPPSTPMYPHAPVVKAYLTSYAEHFHLTQYIQFNTSVTYVTRNSSNTGWEVKLSTGESIEYDLVIVANGHYRIPRYPDTPGLDIWLNSHKAKHSAWYRRPRDLGETVMVVGDGPSARDISAEMATTAKVVIRSISGAANEDKHPSHPHVGATIKTRGRVAQYCDNGKIIFEDGTVEQGVDFCILATGYELSFPFLSQDVLKPGFPPQIPPLPRDAFNSTYHVFPLAKHLFPLQCNYPPSSIAFMCLLTHVVPYPLMEAQARAIVYAFSNPDAIDRTQEAVDIITRYEALHSEFSHLHPSDTLPLKLAKMWHRFRGSEQFDYRDELHQFASPDGRGEVVVPDWVKEMYTNKEILRQVWVDLVKKGEAEGWVKGVGEKGEYEWVDVLRKMLRYAEEEKEKLASVQEENVAGEIAKL